MTSHQPTNQPDPNATDSNKNNNNSTPNAAAQPAAGHGSCDRALQAHDEGLAKEPHAATSTSTAVAAVRTKRTVRAPAPIRPEVDTSLAKAEATQQAALGLAQNNAKGAEGGPKQADCARTRPLGRNARRKQKRRGKPAHATSTTQPCCVGGHCSCGAPTVAAPQQHPTVATRDSKPKRTVSQPQPTTHKVAPTPSAEAAHLDAAPPSPIAETKQETRARLREKLARRQQARTGHFAQKSAMTASDAAAALVPDRATARRLARVRSSAQQQGAYNVDSLLSAININDPTMRSMVAQAIGSRLPHV
jgi:hypothetical protein